ncbi:alpha-2-macroglobulin-like protein 1 [Trichomycterus rosablanca]|uniref:alpha-2-macroglobulin-like protein 1 n=1 Tax=Trichomycterus rosablanca TaxID=2290929 RepID=UPI002F355DA4
MFWSGVIGVVFLLLQGTTASTCYSESIYLLAVNSQPLGGTTETLCVQLRPINTLSVKVILNHKGTGRILLKDSHIGHDDYRCVQFQVPDVNMETETVINLEINEGPVFLNKTTKILIKPRKELIIIQTDKPIYKPGQTVKFRIVSLNSDFLNYNQMFSIIELKDPNSNRIGQWLQLSTVKGLLDLSYPTSPKAAYGIYTITAMNEKNDAITQSFEIKDYVLPKFEVTVQLPPVVSILESSATLEICAKYTYGKPVNGSVKAVLCRNSYKYWWFSSSSDQPPDICKNINMMTGKSGCASTLIDLNDFALTSAQYQDVIQANADVEEYGTGVVLSGSSSMSITANILTITFEDSPPAFKLGIQYEGKIKVTNWDSTPMKNKEVYLNIRYGDKSIVKKLLTDVNGIARFTLETSLWGLTTVTLEAKTQEANQVFNMVGNTRTPYYPTAYLSLEPFYSKSMSFITLEQPAKPFSCNKNAVVTARYLIQGSGLKQQQHDLHFYYMVVSRGRVVQYGHSEIHVRPRRENRGQVSFRLQRVELLAPVAQVVIYTILANGEVIADSMDFPVEQCLPNKVSLNFRCTSELPGSQTPMVLKAYPGSLCSVRAVDQSVLLLSPEKELTIQSVFDLLPVQTLSGYPYNIIDEDMNPCSNNPGIMPFGLFRSSMPIYYPDNGKIDVYNIFRAIGLKIISNAVIKKPTICYGPMLYRKDAVVMDEMALPMAMSFAPTSGMAGAEVAPSAQPITTIRTFFPETWIWDLVPIGKSGMKRVNKTVPDSITTWEAEAFCTSPIGFGVAPRVELTAFQPFFVSLTMPSSVIRGEVFVLKATVFSYLQTCMMIKVTLAESQQFTAEVLQSCTKTCCMCADESLTFSWNIKALVLGELEISVTAEAVQSSEMCGNNKVMVPQRGRIDTVINTLQVLAEGTKHTKTFNVLLCPSDSVIQKTVSLDLPLVYVSDSATASVSVLGDLMGRALKNLDSLLAMPYGCGEQNMLLFAPNIFILQYLESSSQLTPEIRSKAEIFLVSGYQRELTYKHNDGSYSAFGMSDPSGNTWLTAFVMKSFGSAKHYIFIDQVFVDQAGAWLRTQQQTNGCFASVGQLFHMDMKGGVNDEVTLSAYIIAALLELGTSTDDPVVANGLWCLKTAYPDLTSTYALALLSYTFSLAKDQDMKNTLLSILNNKAITSVNGRHWSRDNVQAVDSLEVEMTSYVLLAVLTEPMLPGYDISYAASIVQWLAQQQNAFGGFASTQDTVVALQALALYSTATFSPTGNVIVTVTSESGESIEFTVDQSNRLLYQESELEEIPSEYLVKAEGQGCVYAQFTLNYNIPPEPTYPSFSISATTRGECSLPNPTIYVIVNIKYIGIRDQTNMVIINVKLLSGFKLEEGSVKQLNSMISNGSVKSVDTADGNVIIYLNNLRQDEPMSYSLVIVREFEVQNLKPAVLKVYDYYETGDQAVTEYTSPCV